MLEDQGAIAGDQARRLLRVPGPKGQGVPPCRAVSAAEERRLPAGASAFDAAVFRVLIGTGVGTAMSGTGHRSAQVFLGYDRRGEERKRAAATVIEGGGESNW